MHYLSNINNHFFIVKDIKIDMDSEDLDGVNFYSDKENMMKALAEVSGESLDKVEGTEFVLFSRDGEIYLNIMDHEVEIDIFQSQYYRNNILESCFSVEDFISLFSL